MADNYIYHLPVISAPDFEAFRKVMKGDLPDAYDKWLKLSAKWREEYGGINGNIVEVDMDPDEFSRFVTAEGRRPDMNALLIFSELVGKRYPDRARGVPRSPRA
jgi:hypothetical protein